MHRIVYMSHASESMSDAELDQIRETAVRNNEPRGVTGLLIYVAGTFFQILEGPRAEVEEVYNRVYLDQRHRRVRIMHSGPVSKRRFGNWSMGFCRLSDAAVHTKEFFELSRAEVEDRIPADASNKLVTLMQGFAQTKLAPKAPELF